MTIGNQTVTITQAPANCSYSLSAYNATFSQAGGMQSVNLITQANCPWSIESSASWLTATGSQSGIGPATIAFSVAAAVNSTISQSATLNIAGLSFSVYQSVATTFQVRAGSFLLSQGQSVNFGNYTLTMQSDGNLALYQGSTGVWSSVTAGQDCSANQCNAVFQADGNLAVYNGGKALWSSGTYGYSSAVLIFSSQSPHLEIQDGTTGSILWTEAPVFSGNLTLSAGQSIWLSGYQLLMQVDGNLVLYQGGMPVWSTGTYGHSCPFACRAVFQTDGSFVVYNGTTQLWTNGVSGKSGASLVFSPRAPQLQILGSDGSIFWTNVPQYQAGNFALRQGASLKIGSSTLIMQSDGNLVLYPQTGPASWSTGTFGQPCGTNQCNAVFQGDGNFVVYNGGVPLWSSGTYGNASALLTLSASMPQLEISNPNGSILWTNVPQFQAGHFVLMQGASIAIGSSAMVMQSDGNLVLYSQTGQPLWSTMTYGNNCGSNQCLATFQADGNFVVYKGNTALWNSGTYGNPSAVLVLSPNAPQLTIQGSNQAVLWTNTGH
jgi:hypothetical protein